MKRELKRKKITKHLRRMTEGKPKQTHFLIASSYEYDRKRKGGKSKYEQMETGAKKYKLK